MTRKPSLRRRRPELAIELSNSRGSSKHAYTTRDLVDGKVALFFHEDTIVENFSIVLKGQCTSIVTSLQPWARESPSTKTTHTFLVMQQPVKFQTLAPNQLAGTGSKHEIPFCFTVPETLLPDACQHGLDQESPLSKAHRLLPPSLDDPAFGNTRVEYNVFACLKGKSIRDGSPQCVEKKIAIRIEPIFDPDPPLVIGVSDPDYRLCTTTGLRWSILGSSLEDGYLALHTRQPAPLGISKAKELETLSTPTTYATTTLQFFPGQSLSHPPRLESIKIGLRVFDYSAALPFSESPRPSSHSESTALYNNHSQLMSLGTHLVDGLLWVRCRRNESATTNMHPKNESDPQRGSIVQSEFCSCLSTASAPQDAFHTCDQRSSPTRVSETRSSPSPSFTSPMYQASLDIAVSLSGTKIGRRAIHLVPTFNSCLIGRNYALELTYSFKSPSNTPLSGSSFTSQNCISSESSSDLFNVIVSKNSPKSRIPSKTKKLDLILPLQIIHDSDQAYDRIRPCSKDSDLGGRKSGPSTSTRCERSSRFDSSSTVYVGETARIYHLEDDCNEDPPSYHSAFRARLNESQDHQFA